MPVGQGRVGDFQLDGKPYILQRQKGSGRSWHRTGISDAPGRRTEQAAEYGVLPDMIDHPEVWNDWSGGFGVAYRRQGENTYHWAENFDGRYPRQLIHCQIPKYVSPADTPWQDCDDVSDISNLMAAPFGGPVMIALGGYNGFSTHGFVTFAPVSSATIQYLFAQTTMSTGLPLHPTALWGTYYYFGDSAGTQYHAVDFASNIHNMPLPGFRFAVAGNRLWRAHGADVNHAFYLQSIANTALSAQASVSNWSATLNIGNGNDTIRDMVELEDQLFVGMRAGLYAGDQGGSFFNIFGGLKQGYEDNCRDLCVYNGAVYAPYGGGIFAYRSGQVFDDSPNRVRSQEQFTTSPSALPVLMLRGDSGSVDSSDTFTGPARGTNRGPANGRIRTIRGYGPWLYAGLYTGSQSWLLAGRGQPGGMVWHTLNKFTEVAKPGRIMIDTLSVASSGAPIPHRMWVAMDASIDLGGTAPLLWWSIPPFDANPLMGGSAFSGNYIGSARMDLGNIDWGAPSTPKIYRSFEVWADSLLSGYRYADVYYDVDQSGSFTLLGRAQNSPKSTLYFAAGEGTWVSGQSIELSLRSFTASPAITPVYRSLLLRGALRPKSTDVITAVVQIADNMSNRQGSHMRSGATQIKELRALAASPTPALLLDPTGAQQYVDVLTPIEEYETWQQGMEYPEMNAVVRMAVVTFSEA